MHNIIKCWMQMLPFWMLHLLWNQPIFADTKRPHAVEICCRLFDMILKWKRRRLMMPLSKIFCLQQRFGIYALWSLLEISKMLSRSWWHIMLSTSGSQCIFSSTSYTRRGLSTISSTTWLSIRGCSIEFRSCDVVGSAMGRLFYIGGAGCTALGWTSWVTNTNTMWCLWIL